MGIYIIYLTTCKTQKLNLFHTIDRGAYFQTLETGVILKTQCLPKCSQEFHVKSDFELSIFIKWLNFYIHEEDRTVDLYLGKLLLTQERFGGNGYGTRITF